MYDDKRDRWGIQCEPHVAIKIKQIFSKVSKGDHGVLHLSATDENSRDLEWFLTRFPMEVFTQDVLDRKARAFDDTTTKTWQILSGYQVPQDFDMALPPRPYQSIAAQLGLVNKGLLVADELGLGKTVTALAMLSDPRTLPALVVCPTHLPRQWQREFKRFLPKLTTHICKKSTPYDIGKPDVVILNYHKLSGWADVLAPYVRSVVYDEVQELRRAESNKYRAAKYISTHTEFRMGLSATPIYNYGGEFFNVFDNISPGMLGTRAEFLNEWCRGGYYREDKAQISDPKAFGSYLRESGRMLLRTKKEVGRELPALNRILQEVESNPRYLKKIETAATELASFILKANENRTKGFDVMRASQEFSNTLRQATGIAKAPYVAQFVKMLNESTEEKIVLFGWHREVYSIWADHLRQLNPAWYTGKETASKKEKELQRFLEDDACQVLIMSLRSGSGVDGIQAVSSRCVIGELDWSPGAIEQCIGRLYRDGQVDPVFAYYLTSGDGADPIMTDILGLKKAQIEGVRDPHSELVIKSQVDPSHVKKLAEQYLSRR